MKFETVLIVGRDGLASGLAYALKREGKKVGFYVLKEEAKSILRGVVEHVDDWEKSKDDFDLIIFEDTGFGKRADELKEDGYTVIGASEFCDKLESDREFAVDIAKKYMTELKIPTTETFDNFEDAIKFIKDNSDKKWVIKFNGLAGNFKDLLYLSNTKNNEDLIEVIKFYDKHWQSGFGELSFVLQEKIEGIEAGISGFFNGKHFVKPYYIDKEYKRHLAGDIGVFTGQEGEVQYWTSKKTKLFEITLEKMEQVLAENKYIGSFNVNGILNDEGFWFLEFTPRFGYNSQSIEIEYLRRNAYNSLDWFGANQLDCTPLYAVGFVITVPPYPHASGLEYEQRGKGIPVIFENNKIPQNVYFHDVEYSDGYYRTAGDTGYIMSVVGIGETSEDARQDALDTIRKIYLPKMQYRYDVGSMHGLREVLAWK